MNADEEWLENAKNELRNRSWATERGIPGIDYNNSIVFVRASVEEVARLLAENAAHWDRDVLGREVTVGSKDALVFRLVGHDWTEVVGEPLFGLGTDKAKDLSRRLNASVILYSVSDTCGTTGYMFLESGNLTEEFSASESADGHPDAQSSFHSEKRNITIRDIDNMWSFAHRFFVEQGALEPGIDYEYFFNHGRPRAGVRLKITNPGFTVQFPDGDAITSTPVLERVDHLRFPAQ
jgi:hypothetical protein